MIKRYLQLHAQNFVGSLGRLVRQPFSAVLTGLVIAIALALPAGMRVIVNNADVLSESWEGVADFTVYLQFSVAEDRVLELANEIEARSDVERVEFITRDDALEEFREASGFGSALDALEDNPLPHALVVRPVSEELTNVERSPPGLRTTRNAARPARYSVGAATARHPGFERSLRRCRQHPAGRGRAGGHWQYDSAGNQQSPRRNRRQNSSAAATASSAGHSSISASGTGCSAIGAGLLIALTLLCCVTRSHARGPLWQPVSARGPRASSSACCSGAGACWADRGRSSQRPPYASHRAKLVSGSSQGADVRRITNFGLLAL